MSILEIKILRQLFESGALDSATVSPARSDEDMWEVSVETIKGSREYLTTANARTNKLFRRLPAAIEDARRIGFQEVLVTLPSRDVAIRR